MFQNEYINTETYDVFFFSVPFGLASKYLSNGRIFAKLGMYDTVSAASTLRLTLRPG